MVINCSIGYITINGKMPENMLRSCLVLALHYLYTKIVCIALTQSRYSGGGGVVQCEEMANAKIIRIRINVCALGNSTNAWLQYSVQHVIVDKKWCHFFICETIILLRFAQERKKNNKRFCHTALGTNAIIWIHIYWERARESGKGRKNEKQSTSNYCWIIIFCAIFSILFW